MKLLTIGLTASLLINGISIAETKSMMNHDSTSGETMQAHPSGMMTKEERMNHMKAEFSAADKDGDGKLDETEFQGMMERKHAMMADHGHMGMNDNKMDHSKMGDAKTAK